MASRRDRSRSPGGVILGLVGLALVSGMLGPAAGRATPVAWTQQPTTPVPLVFDGVTVIDVEYGRRIPAQRVVIVGNRIRIMGNVDAVRIPAGARVVNARGKYLIPGLWDLHTHPMGDGKNPWVADILYPLFIVSGVTGIRDAGSWIPIDTLRLWRREILAGTRVGPPRQILSGPALAGPDPGCDRKKLRGSIGICVTDAADARHVVDSLKAAGVDMIKIRLVNRAMYFVLAAESRRAGLPFGGHTEEVTPSEASDSGASIVDHTAFFTADAEGQKYGEHCWGSSATVALCQQVAERFRRNGTWLVPTGTVAGGWESDSPLFARYTERYNAFLNNSPVSGNWLHVSAAPPSTSSDMQIMRRAGLPLLAGTDHTPSGFALHFQLALYVSEGLTPLEALQSATLNPAKLLHATDSLGTVAPGKLADLVLLDADPLADITNTTTIQAVVANGRYFDHAALSRILVAAHGLYTKWANEG